MKFTRPEADIFVPAGGDAATALARTTHLCVIAHQDDIEINAWPAVAACYGRTDRFFTGVVVTNGAGSPRTGPFASYTDDQMKVVRIEEQREAARIGKYNLQIQLAHPSGDVKRPGNPGVLADLTAIFSACRPQTVYLHQPLDKHDTHVGVMLRSLEAIRRLPKAQRPARVLGVEAWRGLDWLLDDEKVPMDCGDNTELALKLIQVFKSQVVGGKRYDLASIGRRQANATFHASHSTDAFNQVAWALDLTPLVLDESLSIVEFALDRVERLRADTATRLGKLT